MRLAIHVYSKYDTNSSMSAGKEGSPSSRNVLGREEENGTDSAGEPMMWYSGQGQTS